MLAIKVDAHPTDPTRLACMFLREVHLRLITPEHQNISLLRSKISTKIQQFLIWPIGRAILRGHIGIEESNPYAGAVARLQSLRKVAQIAGHAFVGVEAEHPVEMKLGARNLQQKSTVPPFRQPAC